MSEKLMNSVNKMRIRSCNRSNRHPSMIVSSTQSTAESIESDVQRSHKPDSDDTDVKWSTSSLEPVLSYKTCRNTSRSDEDAAKILLALREKDVANYRVSS